MQIMGWKVISCTSERCLTFTRLRITFLVSLVTVCDLCERCTPLRCEHPKTIRTGILKSVSESIPEDRVAKYKLTEACRLQQRCSVQAKR